VAQARGLDKPNSGTRDLPIPSWIAYGEHPAVRRVWARLTRVAGSSSLLSPEWLEYTALFGPLVWFLNTGNPGLQGGEWAREPGPGPIREVLRHVRPEFVFMSLALQDLVSFQKAGCRLCWCRFGHYFFTLARHGPLPRVCPIHRPLANQERVRRQRRRYAQAARSR
jgi:hypothetical protein